MIKYLFPLVVISFVSLASFGQTTKSKLDQVKNNPKTTDNAARADVRLINLKNVTDNLVEKEAVIRKEETGISTKKKKLRR